MPSRPAPAVVVPASFDEEFPTGSRRATETFLNVGLLVGGVLEERDSRSHRGLDVMWRC